MRARAGAFLALADTLAKHMILLKDATFNEILGTPPPIERGASAAQHEQHAQQLPEKSVVAVRCVHREPIAQQLLPPERCQELK